MADRKEYMRELMRKKRANKDEPESANTDAPSANTVVESVSRCANKAPESVSTKVRSVSKVPWVTTMPESRFEGYGRGVVVDGYVMVKRRIGRDALGIPEVEHGILKVKDWKARLKVKCPHGFYGFAHDCL